MCVWVSNLRVVHVPEQAALLCVQDEVSPQEAAAALVLLDVQEPTDAVGPIHVRHGAGLPSSLAPGGITRGQPLGDQGASPGDSH